MILTNRLAYNFPLYLFIFAVISSTLNFSVIGPLRLEDIFLIIGFSVLLLSLRICFNCLAFASYCFIISILSVSNIFGILTNFVNYSNIIYYYKYTLIFIVIFYYQSLVHNAIFSQILLKCIFVSGNFLTFWVILQPLLFFFGLIDYFGRTSFPFTQSENFESDSHLLSFVIGVYGIFYSTYLYRQRNHRITTRICLTVAIIISLLLTGSRTGIFVFSFGVTCYMLFLFGPARMLFTVGFIFLSIFLFLHNESTDVSSSLADEPIGLLVTRATNFDLFSDASSHIRIELLLKAIEYSSRHLYLSSPGFIGTETSFWDGIASALLAHGGLPLLFFTAGVLIFVLLPKCRKALESRRTSENFYVSKTLLSVLAGIVVGNLITEYIFTSRGLILPLAMVLFLWNLGNRIEAVPADNQRKLRGSHLGNRPLD